MPRALLDARRHVGHPWRCAPIVKMDATLTTAPVQRANWTIRPRPRTRATTAATANTIDTAANVTRRSWTMIVSGTRHARKAGSVINQRGELFWAEGEELKAMKVPGFSGVQSVTHDRADHSGNVSFLDFPPDQRAEQKLA